MGVTHLTLIVALSLLPAHHCYDICATSEIRTGEVGSQGNVTLGPGPHGTSCQLTLTACAECRVTLYLADLQLAPCSSPSTSITSCGYGCDYLSVDESEYPYYHTEHFFQHNINASFTSTTRRIHIRFCNGRGTSDEASFNILYTVHEKIEVFKEANGGTFMFNSLNFPAGYPKAISNVFKFHIQNTSPGGYIRLWFEDWDMSNSSSIVVDLGGDSSLIERYGYGSRPFIQSTGSAIWVTFDTGRDLTSSSYMGFRAKFDFYANNYWPDQPDFSDCGKYYQMLWGGHFSFETDKCHYNYLTDCVWIVRKFNYFTEDGSVLLRLDKVIFQSGDMLEIRDGLTSTGRVLATRHELVRGMEFVSHSGFYIHLRSPCKPNRAFDVIFSSFKKAEVVDHNKFAYACDHRIESLAMCNNYRCISSRLLCDGFNHCGDDTDERSCLSSSPTKKSSCTTYLKCISGNHWYCQHQRCDKAWQCLDGSDERDCWSYPTPSTSGPQSSHTYGHDQYYWSIVTPIVLICIIMIIIACIIISYYTRRKQQLQRRNLTAAARLSRDMRDIPSVAGDPQLYGLDDPPPYDVSLMMGYNPGQGAFNQGFRSDSVDYIVQPPPYMPKADPQLGVPLDTPPGTADAPPPPSDRSPPPQEMTSRQPVYNVEAPHNLAGCSDTGESSVAPLACHAPRACHAPPASRGWTGPLQGLVPRALQVQTEGGLSSSQPPQQQQPPPYITNTYPPNPPSPKDTIDASTDSAHRPPNAEALHYTQRNLAPHNMLPDTACSADLQSQTAVDRNCVECTHEESVV